MSETTTRAEPGPVVATPLATSQGWFDPAPDRPIPFWDALRQDIIAHVPVEQRPRSVLGWAGKTARIAVLSPGFKVTFCYRFNHTIGHRLGRPGRFVGRVVNWFVHHLYFCAIAPAARLHGGLILPHPQGVIIGSAVVVGPRTWIYHNVTMGGAVGKDGEPKVGADCRIYCGAVVCGPVVLGDEAVVSPLSLVQRNVPGGSMAVGVPATIFPNFARLKG